MPHAEKLSDFLERLAGDEALQRQYCDDPDTVIDDSGLNDHHKKLLKDHHLKKVCEALDDEAKLADPAATAFAVIKGVIKSPTT
jgi:hypothetical protein